MLLYWNKGEAKPLSKHFSSSELSCHCHNASCVRQQISEDLLAKLDALRDELGEAIVITSGYRCPTYQAQLRAVGFETAKGISQHELGNAADLSAADIHTLTDLSSKYFKARGIGRTFIHVDLRADKERVWYYYKR